MSNGQDIPLSRPDITALEIDHVVKVLKSGRLSIGPVQEQFEALVAGRAGAEHAVAVSSGTCGLHLALLALGIKPGDEVITTPFSFVASSNAILYVGAKPVFVDINPRTLNLDPTQVEAAITPRTKAVLAVEAFGNPAHMPELASLCYKHEIPLIEDSCEGFGGSHRGRPIGSFGRVGVFAFYPNKQITCGEGGMIVTDDERIANLCRSMRNQGRPIDPADSAEPSWQNPGSWLMHERLGYNYRLSEIHAALGVAQCKRLDEILEKRNTVASKYMSRLMGMPDVILPTIDPETTMSWFVFVVRLSSEFHAENRDRILAGMRRHEVGVSNYFPPIHLQPFYMRQFGFSAGDFPITESVAQRTIALPFHTRLGEREIDLVCQTLEVMIQREKFTIDRGS
ncbi:MAG: DegT/DnrJ/EryC1/StrS aminotransferase family protein [Phycisphaerales bacterium]|nr:DegT/DnrJ/EryC1/StrS aminotransferase family protein [Phycisphaerales bacterium]